MPFVIVRDDITHVKADAIVNTANPLPTVGRGTDEAVYEAAGREAMLAERKKIGRIEPGTCAVTGAYALPARYVIHTVGPMWQDGRHGEGEILASCYRSCLEKAVQLGCRSIVFPLISSGIYGFPKDLALSIAAGTIFSVLLTHDLTVKLAVYDELSSAAAQALFPCLGQETEENAASGKTEKFAACLLDLMKKKDMQSARVYHGANLSKQHFSKILSHADYHPKRNTVFALALSLECSEKELERLLASAGYILTGDEMDQAVVYFIEHHMYNIVEDNIILFARGLPTLGMG